MALPGDGADALLASVNLDLDPFRPATYFGQSSSSLMINYRVSKLDRMLHQLRRSDVKIEKVEDHDYSRRAWIMDPEGNRIELWEPRGK